LALFYYFLVSKRLVIPENMYVLSSRPKLLHKFPKPVLYYTQ
jgi:hypothetical protein